VRGLDKICTDGGVGADRMVMGRVRVRLVLRPALHRQNVYKLALPESCGRGYGGCDITMFDGFARACNGTASGRIRPAGGAER